LPNSLNVGFRHAQGEYLTWTSDDNQYLPTALEEMLHFLQNRPGIDFVYTDMDVIDLFTGKKTFKACTHWTFYFENIIGASYLYTRKVYETIGDYDPTFEWVEDYDYWLRIEKKFNMRRLPKVLYLYGNHPQSLTSLKTYSVSFLADILRFHHGYTSFDGLVDAVGEFILRFLPFKKGSWQMWKPVIQKVSHMGPQLKKAFWGAIICSMRKKIFTAFNLVWKKSLKLFGKKSDFQNILSDLPDVDTQKIQVLCITSFLSMGGSEKVMEEIVKGLSPKGYDFHLFCFKRDLNDWIKNYLSHFRNFIGVPAVYDVDIYAKQVIGIINQLKISIIILTNEHMAYKAIPKIKEACPGVKIIDIIHLEKEGGTRKHLSLIAAPYLDRRVCISHHLMAHMKEEYRTWGIPANLTERLLVIHNGTDLTQFSPEKIPQGRFRAQHQIPENVKIISFAARMANEKTPFIFVDIARSIIAQNPSIPLRFVMAGNGPLWGNLLSKIKDYHLENYFIFPGVLTDIAELLRDSYIFVVVSTREGIPLSIQESLFMNIPVISTRVGAIHEIIVDGSNGFLINRDELVVDHATSKIQYLLEQHQEHQRMADNCRKSIYPEFSNEFMHQRYAHLLKEVLR